MSSKGRNFATAITLTILDLVVALRYGAAVWQAYSGVIWSRLLLLLFVAVWVTGLADLWSRTRGFSQNAPRKRRIRLSDIAPIAETERADV